MHSIDAANALCGLTADPRPYVRANAFAGLALAGHRCKGDPGRTALGNDPSDEVRAAAALQLSRSPGPEDVKALELCARADASGFVAGRCRVHRPPPAPGGPAHPTLVYVVPEGGEVPRPGAPCAVLLADGLLRTATTDRRGAVFDPVAPEGEISLRRASALER
ncbi:MAG TPA: HEAT repeat domain-containing protein [Polyangiaceae bacterium]